MTRIIAAVLILLGVAGILQGCEGTVTNGMKAYVNQDADVAAQNSYLVFASFGALFVGAILLEVERRKTNRREKP